jgi:hypothetical protein
MPEPDPSDSRMRPPFWKHRYYYLALKIVVLLFGLALALRLFGFI